MGIALLVIGAVLALCVVVWIWPRKGDEFPYDDEFPW